MQTERMEEVLLQLNKQTSVLNGFHLACISEGTVPDSLEVLNVILCNNITVQYTYIPLYVSKPKFFKGKDLFRFKIPFNRM